MDQGVSIRLDGAVLADDSGGGVRNNETNKSDDKFNKSDDKKTSSTAMSSLAVPAPAGVFPLPNSQQVASSSSLNVGSATGNPRNKVALRKGFSLMDWIRLTNSGQDLAGVGGRLIKVTKRELAKHSRRTDAWMALNGKVYNVTAYMDYHPGGWDELVKGAGKDATNLFNEVHRWVNYESMLSACLVGKLVEDRESEGGEKKNADKSKGNGGGAPKSDFARPSPLPSAKPDVPPGGASPPPQGGFLSPLFKIAKMLRCEATSVIPPIKPKPQKPTYDFHQTAGSFVVSIYTRNPDLQSDNVIVDLERGSLSCLLLPPSPDRGMAYSLQVQLSDEEVSFRGLRVNGSGKAEVTLAKCAVGSKTEVRSSSDRWRDLSDLPPPRLRDWTLASRSAVTRDVDLLVLAPPREAAHFRVPVGHHVQLVAEVEGVEVARSYTPVPASLTGNDGGETGNDGQLHFLIKTYEDGALTPRLKRLRPGDAVRVSDHTGRFAVPRCLRDGSSTPAHLALLAAGTGLTPMVGLIRRLLVEKDDNDVIVKLLFFNKTEEDIIWRTQLEDLSRSESRSKRRFSVEHILSEQESWSGEKGRISKQLLERRLINESSKFGNRRAAICGPNAFTDRARDLLLQVGYSQDELIVLKG